MDVLDIILRGIKEAGGNGLVNVDHACGCGGDTEVCPCGDINLTDCRVAKWQACCECSDVDQCHIREEYDIKTGCMKLVTETEISENAIHSVAEIVKRFEDVAYMIESNGNLPSVCDNCHGCYPEEWIINNTCPFCGGVHTEEETINEKEIHNG